MLYYFILLLKGFAKPTFKILFIYLLLERREGKEKERERNIIVWLSLTCPLLGTWPTTQACALTGNRTSDPLFCRPALNPLSYTSQGSLYYFKIYIKIYILVTDKNFSSEILFKKCAKLVQNF